MVERSKRIVRIPSHRRLSRANLFGKIVLVRSDFNVPIKDGRISDLQRIASGVPTIKKIFEKDAKQVNIICHLGQPDSVDKNFSTTLIAGALANLLHLRAAPVKVNTEFKSPALSVCYQLGEKVRLFENLRFDPREKLNSAEFAGELPLLQLLQGCTRAVVLCQQPSNRALQRLQRALELLESERSQTARIAGELERKRANATRTRVRREGRK